MGHQHLHHARAPAPVIGQWHENQRIETVITYITVTSPRPSPSPSYSREIGDPIAMTRSASTSGAYSAPSRQHRPEQATSTAGSTHQTAAPPHTTLVSSTIPSSLLVASSTGVLANSFGSTAPVASGSADLEKSTQSHGMSGGAKAGLAIGILLVVALMAGLAFFIIRRKKQEAEDGHRLDDEKIQMRQKSQSVSSHVSVRQTKTNAPRLSLRPVTQMFMGISEKQEVPSTNPAASTRAITPEAISQVPVHETSNPFGDDAEQKAIITAPVAAANAASAYSGNSSDRTLSNLSDRSPSSGDQPFPTAVAGSRRNSPPGPGPNNVHRVQLDFKPSMEDELELRAGSLVRLLHEYDDGWALCIRLDRSQQGVVPRTCISKLPVKPRQGPPPQGAMRGPAPPAQGRSRGGSNAPGPRVPYNGTPRGPPPSQRLRSQSNAPRQIRPQSPAQPYASAQSRPRANSDALSARHAAPTSPTNGEAGQASQAALPSRKPVPGQAI